MKPSPLLGAGEGLQLHGPGMDVPGTTKASHLDRPDLETTSPNAT
jgi:hypothetical protein